MLDEARKQRAIVAVAKYRETLTSDERIAAFAVWFAEQEFGWKDARKDPPTDMMLVLLKDTKRLSTAARLSRRLPFSDLTSCLFFSNFCLEYV